MRAARRRVIDVGDLPAHAFGHRDPLWWGLILLVCIEGTMLVLLALSYFYVRGRMTPWPVDVIPGRIAWLGTIELALWLAAAIPTKLSSDAALRFSVRGMRAWMIVATIPAIAAVVIRYEIFRALPFRWDANAYASIVWTLLGAQWLHGLTTAGENVLYIALFFVGPVEEKHAADVHVSTPIFYFTVAGAALVWALLYAGRIL